MKIVFNLYNTGLGNNGGSRTLVKCGRVLCKLGHEIIFYSNVLNKYTWHNLKNIQFIVGNKCPNGHVVIATGYYSVEDVLRSKIKKKFYYIRAHELWNASEKKLLSCYRSLKCIVNSEWLKKYLSSHNIKSELIYPGIDDNKFCVKQVERENIFGALYSKLHKTKRHEDAVKISQKTGYKLEMLNRDIKNPKEKVLNNWYNKIKVWFAPTELEGLHNPPIESSLSGCALICTDYIRNGMNDYAVHGKTAMVYPARDLNIASEYLNKLMMNEELRLKLQNNMVELLNEKIGSRGRNMRKFIKYLKQ